MDFHVYLHVDSVPSALLERILKALDQINQKESHMANELSDLQAAVANNTSVTQSATTLIQGIKAALDAAIAAGDPAALTALSASLGSDDTALAAAVAANTPAAAKR